MDATAHTHISTLLRFRQELNQLQLRASLALAADNMPEHMRLGRVYHELADAVLTAHGVEMRPQD